MFLLVKCLLVATLFVVAVHSQQLQQLLRQAQQQPSASPSQSQVQSQQAQAQQLQLLLKQQQQQQPQQQQPFLIPQQPPQQQFVFAPQQQPQNPFFAQGQQFSGQLPPQQQRQFFSQPQRPAQAPPQAPQGPPPGPQINWGKCPQLEPSEKEKLAKAGVITKCLETTPLPNNITRETVELHREQIAACALSSEGWFTKEGGYDFNKAETEIKNKKLNQEIEHQVLTYHRQCKAEAEDKFPTAQKHVIAQIQLYQACMDYFISDVCGIEVNEPDGAHFA